MCAGRGDNYGEGILMSKGGEGMRPKVVTIRIPFDLWVELRRAQEKGRIKSIQSACIAGLESIVGRKEANGEPRATK